MQNLQNSIYNLFTQYKDIDGNYCSTLIQGVAQFMLNSGIYTDSFSANDATKIAIRTQNIEYDSDAFYAAVENMTDLQCDALYAAVDDLATQYNVDADSIIMQLVTLEEEEE